MPERHQVVIVGGGPVGMGLAVDLGLRGIECVVIERHETPHPIPKGQNLTQRTMEHFVAWGVEDQMRAARQMPPGYPNSGVNAYGNLMSDYSYPWWQRSMVSDYYSRPNERIPQYETERVLRDKAASLPTVETMFGWSAEGIEGSSARIAHHETGRERTVIGEVLVGCDGSHSTVRESAGITETLSDHGREMVLLVFRSKGLHRALERFGEVSFFNILPPGLDGYWRFLGRVDAGEQWFFHAPVPPEVKEGSDFAGLLHDAVGTTFECEFDYIGFWDLRFAVADQYRKGPVILAGDAAHSHPPYGGYGINTGFEDVRNLGWKLEGLFRGWGGEALLDSYAAERLPVFRSTASDFIEKMIDNGREFLSKHDPEVDREDFEEAWEMRRQRSTLGVADFEPHYEGSPIVFGPDGGVSGAVGSHVFTARAGHHLPPRGGVFDALGPGFTLLAFDASADAVSGFDIARDELGVPLEVVRRDFDGEVAEYKSRLVLVRPDHYVSWVGNDADTTVAREVLARSAGR
jgi:2-polyprenyl-6-methoxyphenol hydroxylase-like FAD-dependent oxidoreductase